MMEWEEVRDRWQQTPSAADMPPLPQADDTRRLWAVVRRRDWLETLVAIALIPMFGFAAFRMMTAGEYLAAFFAAFITGAVIYVPLRLWHARRKIPRPDPQQPVREFLLRERDALIHQASMLRSVSRWYSGPLGLGAVGFYTSISGFGWDAAGYALVVLLMCIGIEFMNRRAASRKFSPAIAAVNEQIKALEDSQ